MTRALTLVGYVVLAAAAVGLQVAARRRGTATFSDTLRLGLLWPAFRVLFLAAWLWLGWHVFVRVDWE